MLQFCIFIILRYSSLCNHDSMLLRAYSRLAPSQWETSSQSNAVSRWLGANLESALLFQCLTLVPFALPVIVRLILQYVRIFLIENSVFVLDILIIITTWRGITCRIAVLIEGVGNAYSLGRYWRDSRPRHCSRADIPAWRPNKITLLYKCSIWTCDIWSCISTT